MKRVFFIGAGGVGKTSVLEELTRRLTASGIQIESFKSVSRDFFKAEGITTEQAGLDRPEEDRLTFQSRLFDFYSIRLQEETYKAKQAGVDVMVADRSPFDHLAYLMYNAPNVLTYEQLNSHIEKANALLTEDSDSTLLIYFPCTGSWMNEKVVADGMRHAPPGKNFIIGSLIEGLAHASGFIVYTLGSEDSIDERTTLVMKWLGYSMLHD